ncbi:MAG: UDP-N-acetylmuramoyl-L-alanine--D-glutamate ligase [Bacteroidales bacterium]|jgi:UDP-N-acetylmuramoylalanine--D-glutamate ligase|nr:UDP-N-acetylmuramoyl-L-alanine--D-glutamate ligase [Bacteroidales bacterium]
MNKKLIVNYLKDKKIIILGFGKEGMSSYRFIRSVFPELPLTVADRSEQLNLSDISHDSRLTVITGASYAQNLNDYDLILKTPGVNLNHINYFIQPNKISSQTALFLQAFGSQTIGVTGTKGKSTTASLIYHILHQSGLPTVLAGNIGIPFFDIIDNITLQTTVIAELSAHQLEFIRHAPHIAILLNLYQEHLDHFNSFANYQQAKLNICRYQTEHDFTIYNSDDVHINYLLSALSLPRNYLPYSRNRVLENGAYSFESKIVLAVQGKTTAQFDLQAFHNLPGSHNYYNIMGALLACKLKHISDEAILKQLHTFRGLEHRIEFVGRFNNIKFYNDSISTIPETTMAAVRTIKDVDTLILGGLDRGVDYSQLIDFLISSSIKNFAFTGPAGERILAEWCQTGRKPSNFIVEYNFEQIVAFAYQCTQAGKSCLLSPAAASYNQFKNFEERGRLFKSLITSFPHITTEIKP